MEVAPEEIRFAVVLNGGVSLAVWMGGVALELDRLTNRAGLYEHFLNEVGSVARVDVITGTSAGGINGAALALSQVNEKADLSSLRDLWVEQGAFEQLLRPPFSGQPMSLLQGDEFFLPKLRTAFTALTKDFVPRPASERPIDLRITTTLLNGVPKVTFDDLGQPLVQTVHQGVFNFRRDPAKWAKPPNGRWTDDFYKRTDGENTDFTGDLEKTIDRLALAARSTASFPFAFEPSFVQVRDDDDMGEAASWFAAGTDRSRFAVDGGVLVNTPTKEALEAIDRMPANGLVRRVMLLVFPHAPVSNDEPRADTTEKPPTIVGAGGRLLTALYSQSGRTYVDKVEDHNRAAASRRGGRNDLLERLQGPDFVKEIYDLAKGLRSHYEDLMIRYVAREVTTQQIDTPGANKEGWSFERVRLTAEKAQRAYLKSPKVLPYVPADVPPTCVYDQGWPWGFTMAERLASAALDLLKRLVWVTSDADYLEIKEARRDLHMSRCNIRNLREQVDAGFTGSTSTRLDSVYWTDRLTYFAQRMVGPDADEGNKLHVDINRIGDVVERARSVLIRLDEPKLKMADLQPWHKLLLQDLTDAEKKLDGKLGWVSRLLALEIAATCLGDEAPKGLDQPVELAQVSLQTKNAFAKLSVTPDDKAGGASLARFSGFLKRSWRVNDWIWGRLDAATMLCKIVFDPERLWRRHELNPQGSAADLVDGLVRTMFGGTPNDPELRVLIDKATAEVTRIYAASSAQDLEPSALALAELAAWGLHVRIIVEELPALRAAILADANDGANSRSRGELFVTQYAKLLDDLPTPRTFDNDLATNVQKGLDALQAFDRAGIGREPLKAEAGSDQMIRTAATAAATAVTVLDSDRSGLAVVKPVTRAIRGGALLPYWMVIGLTKGSRVANGLAVLAGTLGVAMLVLAMFTLLPVWAIAPAATAGAALLLGMFGYEALRSGTMLHGLVLLSPMIPLGIYAADRWRHHYDDPETAQKASTATVSLAGILVMAIVLVVLGSIPAVRKTPLALLFDASGRLGKAIGRRPLTTVWIVVVGVFGVAAVSGGMLPDVYDGLRTISFNPWWLLIVVVPALFVARWQGRTLKLWSAKEDTWILSRAEHPAAAVAGWAAVYGGVYLAIGIFVARLEFSSQVDRSGWLKHGIAASAFVMAAVLLLVTTWLVPVKARSKIRRTLVAEATRVLYPDGDYALKLLARLEACGLLCSYLVEPQTVSDRQVLVLCHTGRRIADEIELMLTASAPR
ncbi:hypothetical protein Lesp02_08490 [Lentzea sp. NBRC 105346]|uniref:patatin-like protein n=1 Tax=Lentzea sp. NBRC 105346 TaxID=3032205 RepID=UPI0024A0D9D1|nr:patatin-like protein [Lentzea sp. NBRC 105346]GLZ28659.1 hypothetical protein Lesp02_08490 [Lentzea sp. NBRC 105346]